MKFRNLIFILVIFFVFSCKKENIKPKLEYNQKANELIKQLINEEKCDCVLEIPKQTLIEIENIEYRKFNTTKYYIEKLKLKNKKELDSLNELSKSFALDTSFLKSRKIKLIKRDSLQKLFKNINFTTKICKKGLTYFVKPIFNKEFTIAVIDYGDAGMCVGIGRRTFEFTNNKWKMK